MVYEFNDAMARLYNRLGWEKAYEGGAHGSDKEYIAYHFLEYVLNAFVTMKPTNVTAEERHARAEQCVGFLNDTAASAHQSLTSFVTVLASNLSSDWTNNTNVSYGSCFGPFLEAAAGSSSHDDHSTGGDHHDDHGHGHGHDDHHYPEDWRKLSHHGYKDHSLLDVAHKLHYISIAILSVLVMLIFIKIFCSGRRFFKSRMQVFDGAVILISFTLDIVFIEGLAVLGLEEFIIIITFLLPWRILRVVNSLIAAVLDQQRLNLKIIYRQKKKISRNLSETNSKLEVMQRHIEVLQALCSSRGLSVVNGEIVGTRNAKPSGKDHHHSSSSKGSSSGGGLASMMALGKLAFQAADTLAPISNGYTHGSHNNNTSSHNSNNNNNSSSSNGKSSLAVNGHAVNLSASDDRINRGDHPSHEPGVELTPAGHVRAESDSELFTLEHDLQQQQQQREQQQQQQQQREQQQQNDDNSQLDVEAGGSDSVFVGRDPSPSGARVTVESERSADDNPPSTSGASPAPSRKAAEIIASPSTLEADLDSVRLHVDGEDSNPTAVTFAPAKPSSSSSTSNLQSTPPPPSPPVTTAADTAVTADAATAASRPSLTSTTNTTTPTQAEAPQARPLTDNASDNQSQNINDSDIVSKL